MRSGVIVSRAVRAHAAIFSLSTFDGPPRAWRMHLVSGSKNWNTFTSSAPCATICTHENPPSVVASSSRPRLVQRSLKPSSVSTVQQYAVMLQMSSPGRTPSRWFVYFASASCCLASSFAPPFTSEHDAAASASCAVASFTASGSVSPSAAWNAAGSMS